VETVVQAVQRDGAKGQCIGVTAIEVGSFLHHEEGIQSSTGL
jgi:hypothetical protein